MRTSAAPDLSEADRERRKDAYDLAEKTMSDHGHGYQCGQCPAPVWCKPAYNAAGVLLRLDAEPTWVGP